MNNQAEEECPLHRRNKERARGALSPQIWSKIWKIRSRMGAKSCKIGPFFGVVIHKNSLCKTKFKTLGIHGAKGAPLPRLYFAHTACFSFQNLHIFSEKAL